MDELKVIERMLVIDEGARNRITAVLSYAQDHIFSADAVRILSANQGTLPPTATQAGFNCKIGDGYHCTYSLERHPQEAGPNKGKDMLARHLSVSVQGDGFPAPKAVMELMKLFEFERSMIVLQSSNQGAVFREDRPQAINIVEAIKCLN